MRKYRYKTLFKKYLKRFKDFKKTHEYIKSHYERIGYFKYGKRSWWIKKETKKWAEVIVYSYYAKEGMSLNVRFLDEVGILTETLALKYVERAEDIIVNHFGSEFLDYFEFKKVGIEYLEFISLDEKEFFEKEINKEGYLIHIFVIRDDKIMRNDLYVYGFDFRALSFRFRRIGLDLDGYHEIPLDLLKEISDYTYEVTKSQSKGIHIRIFKKWFSGWDNLRFRGSLNYDDEMRIFLDKIRLLAKLKGDFHNRGKVKDIKECRAIIDVLYNQKFVFT